MLFLPNDVKRFLVDYTRASTYYAVSRVSRNIYSALTTKQYSKRSIHRFLRVINECPPNSRYTDIYYNKYAVTPAGWLYGWIDEYFDCLDPVLNHSERPTAADPGRISDIHVLDHLRSLISVIMAESLIIASG